MNNIFPGKKRSTPSQKYFGLLERRASSDRLLLQVVLALLVASALYAIITISNQAVTAVPSSGGSLVEGIVGTPRFVNPVLATTRADRDMAALIYSGLMKIDASGTIVPDLAESVTLSEDGQTYSVKLRRDAYFHNGARVTARDVAYTIALIQNPDLKSPLQGNWDSVLVEERGELELNIVVSEPYTPFIENLTVGILPRAFWNELPIEQLPFSQNNTEPVGSGLYQIEEVVYNKSGLIEAYQLRAADNYQADPNITTLEVRFYPDEATLATALGDGEVLSTASLSALELAELDTKTFTVNERPLPRTFAIYFNQNKSPVLRDQAVREALSVAIDRDALIEAVVAGYGTPNDTPIPAGFLERVATTSADFDPLTRASGILTDAGWSQNESGQWLREIDDVEVTLSISLTTANTPLFDAIATAVTSTWEELGVEVNVAQFEQTDLVQAIIRPRDFQALLFGADIGRQTDLYPFWHSSQKSDPGLNISQFTNIEVDSLLEDIRTETDRTTKQELNQQIIDLIISEYPAVFLFTPTFGYVHDPHITVSLPDRIDSPSERFAEIGSWYMSTDRLWPMFSNSN